MCPLDYRSSSPVTCDLLWLGFESKYRFGHHQIFSELLLYKQGKGIVQGTHDDLESSQNPGLQYLNTGKAFLFVTNNA
jgi:hypothetical protein